MDLGVVITGLIGLLFIRGMESPVENKLVKPAVRVIVGEVMAVVTGSFLIKSVSRIVYGLVAIVASQYTLNDEGAAASWKTRKSVARRLRMDT